MTVGTLPAERLYWARLPASEAGTSSQARRFRFERVVPMPVERLHIVEQRQADGAWVLAGIDRADLHRHLADLSAASAAPLVLLPDRIPPHLGVDTDPRGLNLLVGEFEPDAVRHERRRWWLTAACAACATLLILALGAWRRSAVLDHATADLASRRDDILRGAVGDMAGPASPEARLVMAVRRYEQASRGQDDPASRQEAWEVMEAVLAAWPVEVPVRLETFTATPDRCVIRGVLGGFADADRLTTAMSGGLKTPAGTLRPEPLQVQQDGGRSVFVLTLVVVP